MGVVTTILFSVIILACVCFLPFIKANPHPKVHSGEKLYICPDCGQEHWQKPENVNYDGPESTAWEMCYCGSIGPWIKASRWNALRIWASYAYGSPVKRIGNRAVSVVLEKNRRDI